MAVSDSIYKAANSTLATIKSYLGGDDKLNKEVIHDPLRDIDADNWNLIVSGLGEVAKRTRRGNLVSYKFFIAKPSAGASGSMTLIDNGTISLSEIAAFADASLVGVSVTIDDSCTAGTLTITPQLNGSSSTLTAVINSTTATDHAYNEQLSSVETVDQSQLIGCDFTADGSFAAGSATIVCAELFISYGEESDL